MKYCLLLCLLAATLSKGYAGAFDSLSKKEDVLKFLTANLSRSGIIFLKECAGISVAEKKRIYFASQSYPFDTAMIKDPVSGKMIMKLIPHDPDTAYGGLEIYPANMPFDYVASLMDKTPWHFYKADIDRNGRTDLVIDVGIVVIVMDMGSRFEGHMFTDSRGWNSYGFKNFISLPNGNTALVLRHDHNPCKAVEHSYLTGTVTYVTNTSAGKGAMPKIDTLYKITTGIVPDRRISEFDSLRKVESTYADTVDMRLYNMTDTIVYKNIGFTKYIPDFKPAGIAKIKYYYNRSCGMTGMAEGASYMEINRDGKCFLQYPGYEETFSAMLDCARSKKLWDFMSCIDIKSKKDFYRCEVDHSTGATFAFYFDDGTVKAIDFWAYRPPMDLGYLSNELADISRIVNWQLSEKRPDIEWKLPSLPDAEITELYNGFIECNCSY